VPTWSLRPPPLVLAPEVAWALLRAFAPPHTPLAGAVEGERAVAAAVTHDLAVRIAWRIPAEQLAGEVGQGQARELAVRQLAAEVVGERLLELAQELSERLGRLGVPVALLKFAALRLGGHVAAGSRGASDLDLLVPAAAAGTVQAELRRAGFSERRLLHVPHHLPTLLAPSGMAVEVHTALPGVAGDATFQELLAAGLLERCHGLAGEGYLPKRRLLVAHCLAHGLLQHGLAPQAYPPARMLADLVDLGLAGEEGARLGEEAYPLLVARLPQEAVTAACSLGRVLAAGEADKLLADNPNSTAGVLLRHVLAGPVDQRYQEALRWSAIAGLDGTPRSLRQWLGELWQALYLTRGQVEVMHGPQASQWGYLYWRARRPLELALRLPRYAWAALRHLVARPPTHPPR
jgi:hypothetical protein